MGRPLTGHEGAVNGVAFSPDGRLLASVSDDSTMRLWDARAGRTIATSHPAHATIYAVAFSPDGSMLVTGSEDKIVRRWDARTLEPIGEPLTGHTDAVYAVAVQPEREDLRLGRQRQDDPRLGRGDRPVARPAADRAQRYASFRDRCEDTFGPLRRRLVTELGQDSAHARLREVQHLLCDLVEALDPRGLRYAPQELTRA